MLFDDELDCIDINASLDTLTLLVSLPCLLIEVSSRVVVLFSSYIPVFSAIANAC